MKLQKADNSQDMPLNMTPMIDVVFQLIIFFMLINDMSQKELEELELPTVEKAMEDKPDPKDMRPILNITYDGVITIKKKPYYDPEVDQGLANPYQRVEEWLAATAKVMKTAPLDEKDPSSPKIPDDALLIRADIVTPFKHIQKVMELCGKQGIQIWKVQLACHVPEANKDDEDRGRPPQN